MNVGDRINICGFTLDDGPYVKQCEVVSLDNDSIQLKHIATSTRGGNDVVEHIQGDNNVTTYDKKMIAHLSVPFEQRCRKNIDDMHWLCKQLSKSRSVTNGANSD